MLCMSGADVARISACCPGLGYLTLRDVAGEDVVTGLRGLPAFLQELHVAGDAFGDAATAAVAQLTQLQVLGWGDSPLTPAGLQQLTALQGTTQLQLPAAAVDADADSDDHKLHNEAGRRMVTFVTNEEVSRVRAFTVLAWLLV